MRKFNCHLLLEKIGVEGVVDRKLVKGAMNLVDLWQRKAESRRLDVCGSKVPWVYGISKLKKSKGIKFKGINGLGEGKKP